MTLLDEGNEKRTLEEQLAVFLKNNPHSRIEKRGKLFHLVNAWNLEFVSFVLKPDLQSQLVPTLNNLVLPPRFTAIYHLDTNMMEYIFTLLDRNSPYLSRKFDFTVDGRVYQCQFADASERLLLLGKSFRPAGDKGDDRNLTLLSMYTNPDVALALGFFDKSFFRERRPVSFFVGQFDGFDEGKIVEVSKHLNFFMQYYDRNTSYILIHSPESSELHQVKQLQFINTEFPKAISTRRKDPFLLDLALAAREANARLAFIYYYQILEYVAFYYVESDTRRRMLQVITAPDIAAYPDKYLARILDMVGEIRQDDAAKLNKVVETCSCADIVWKEVTENLPYFSKKLEFEGGFAIEPFVSPDTTLESFSSMWIPKTPDTLRKIRNALVHARESRAGLVIIPTRENELKLIPWLHLIRRIAEQILIFN